MEPLDTLWRMHTGMEFFAAPAVCGGVLYSGGNDGLFRAVDAADGTVRWSHATACGISSEAAVTDSAVFFGGQDGYVYALSRAGGRVLWTAGLGYHVFASCAVMADTVLVTGNSDGKVAALDTRTGGVLWHGTPGGVVLGPAVADTIAVFSTEDGVVSAWTVSGRELWHRDFPAQASAPAIGGPGVLAGFADGTVRCLSLSDGSALWETDLTPSPGRVVVSRPACAGGRLVVGTCDSRVVCLSSTDGSVEWETVLENWIQVPPAVGDSVVYVSCDDRRLHLLDLDTGSIISSREMGGYSGTAPLLINGVLYLGTASGDLLALRGSLPPAGD
jgi:outer membrane protein assembly factor BamB